MVALMPRISCCLITIVLVGCGGGPKDDSVPVRGQVTNAGAPLKVNRPDVGLGYVEVHFYRIADDGSVSTDPADAAVDESGNFTVRGRDGHGLPPGKYRITVRQLDPAPDNDKLQGRFNLKNSKIVRDVSPDQEIVIDVSRPEG
jgi:hypothetical protein